MGKQLSKKFFSKKKLVTILKANTLENGNLGYGMAREY